MRSEGWAEERCGVRAGSRQRGRSDVRRGTRGGAGGVFARAFGRFRGLRPTRVHPPVRPDSLRLRRSAARPRPPRASAPTIGTLRSRLSTVGLSTYRQKAHQEAASLRIGPRDGPEDSLCRARGFTPASPSSSAFRPRRTALAALFHGTIAEGKCCALPLGLPLAIRCRETLGLAPQTPMPAGCEARDGQRACGRPVPWRARHGFFDSACSARSMKKARATWQQP